MTVRHFPQRPLPRTLRTTLLMLALGAPSLIVHADGPTQSSPLKGRAAGRVIVKFRADSPLVTEPSQALTPAADRAKRVSQRLNIDVTAGRAPAPRMQVLRSTSLDSAAFAAALRAQPDVEFASPDELRRPMSTVRPNDVYFQSGRQWYLDKPSTTEGDPAINAVTAWALSKGVRTDTAAAEVVAVLDTGVRSQHPDLTNKLLAGYDMVSADIWRSASVYCTANDADGRDALAEDPGDGLLATELGGTGSVFPSADCQAGDSTWHGTEVAGIVGAETDNTRGIAGIGWSTAVLPVRVLGKCGGYDSDIIAGMRWAAGLAPAAADQGLPVNPKPARILNLSLGGSPTCTSAYQSVIAELRTAGTVIVAAAGNGSSGTGGAVSAPGSCPGVIAVGGLTHTGLKAPYSNFGPGVAISAPSGDSNDTNYSVVTTTDTGAQAPGLPTYSNDANRPAIGTSFSAPMVSATVALMRAAEPRLSPDDIDLDLKSTARPFPVLPTAASAPGSASSSACSVTNPGTCYCDTSTCGAGMLDAGEAVNLAKNGPHPRIAAPAALPQAGVAFELDGSASYAQSGNLATWLWEVVLPANATGITLGSPNTPKTSVLVTVPGDYVVRLTVTDAGVPARTRSRSYSFSVAAPGATTAALLPTDAAEPMTVAAVATAATSVTAADTAPEPVLACTANVPVVTPPVDSGGGGGASSALFLALLGAAAAAAAALRRVV